MTLPAARKRFTPAEYYQLERDARYKSDFHDGEIFAMAGGTADHSQICANIVRELGQRLKGKPCVVFESNFRVKIEATGLRTYSDASVYCTPVQYDPEDPEKTTGLNPTVVVEVLSPSTEAYDRGFKAENYRRIQSLRAHLIVAQDRPHVELYHRPATGSWTIDEVDGLDKSIRIDAMNVALPLSEIYDKDIATLAATEAFNAGCVARGQTDCR